MLLITAGEFQTTASILETFHINLKIQIVASKSLETKSEIDRACALFCVVSWTVFVRVVFTDLVRT